MIPLPFKETGVSDVHSTWFCDYESDVDEAVLFPCEESLLWVPGSSFDLKYQFLSQQLPWESPHQLMVQNPSSFQEKSFLLSFIYNNLLLQFQFLDKPFLCWSPDFFGFYQLVTGSPLSPILYDVSSSFLFFEDCRSQLVNASFLQDIWYRGVFLTPFR